MARKPETPSTGPDRKSQQGETPETQPFQEAGTGILRVTNFASPIAGTLNKISAGLRRGLFGMPLASAEESAQRLPKSKALPILASDNISSSAYATENLTRVLAFAGAGATSLTMPISFALVAVVAIVATSFTQVIRAYPGGGGSYEASRENLGTTAGLISASCLLIDYVLTVAVSIAAGVAAVTSALPELYDHRVLLALVAITMLTVANLRGVRESGALFSVPTYIYLLAIFGLIGISVFRLATGTMPEYTPPPDWLEGGGQALTLLLVLRAFSAGAVALTGVEAVADGLPMLKRPEARNGIIVLFMMAGLFSIIFLGLGFLTTQIGLVPDPEERQTLVSQLATLSVGRGWFHVVVQGATAMLLFLAANTAFVGFPRISLVLARDRFMPNQFAFRGRRLSLATGIGVVGVMAALLIVVYQGSVSSLIPLYTVGVFIAFTLAQVGLVIHWRRSREKGRRFALALNAFGAFVTCTVAIEVVITKFTQGAWIIVLLIPLLSLLMRSINRHYRLLGRQLRLDTRSAVRRFAHPQMAIVPIADLNKPVIEALAYARSMSPDVRAVHVSDDLSQVNALRDRWEQMVPDVPLVIIESPYRDWTGPLLRYIQVLSQRSPNSPVTVVVPEFVPKHWWEYFLHSQSALRLKMALLSKPNIVVVDIPYQLRA
ncbi:MAG: APC family permease [SAR202 cluster bacterium]|nr:APC family permease [SAR202 cluster bacterium]